MSNTSEIGSLDQSRHASGEVRPALAAGTQFAISRDGTRIAYSRHGNGPALILVDGALCHRTMGPSAALATALAGDFTVFSYDRRGRNESGDTLPYASQSEIEDVEAILREAGGTAFLWGMSSGAMLAVSAASQLPGIRKLVTYEAPLIVDDSRKSTELDWQKVRAAIAAGRRGDAVRAFLASVGMPRPIMLVMQLLPIWKTLKAVAHTLPHDGAIVEASQHGKPLGAGPWEHVAVPTLVTDGGASPTWMRHGNQALADAIVGARYQTLAKLTHMLDAKAYAPTLIAFFKD